MKKRFLAKLIDKFNNTDNKKYADKILSSIILINQLGRSEIRNQKCILKLSEAVYEN